MKTILITLFLILVLSSFTTQDNIQRKATVDAISDIPVFMYAEPLAKYKVVGKAVTMGNILKMMIDEEKTIREKAQDIVAKTFERKKNGKIGDFDAIIFDFEKEKILAIKFEEELSTKAKISSYEGVVIYFFSSPDDEYDIVAKLPADYSMRAERNGTLDDKILSMVRRSIKKNESGEVGDFDAIIFSPDDLSQTLIKFK